VSALEQCVPSVKREALGTGLPLIRRGRRGLPQIAQAVFLPPVIF
jgi:hypothetical protein